MLPHLHANRRLVKIATDAIEMTPTIGVSVLLSELNQIIAEQRGIAVDGLCIAPGSNDKTEVVEVASAHTMPTETADVGKTTSASVNETAPEVTSFDSPESQAKYYRSQADRLAKQAAEFRRKAEDLSPAKKKVKDIA